MSDLRSAAEPEACLCLVLHAHLPYVRHPEYKDFIEEDWFFEAVTDTYLRLAAMLVQLRRDGVPFRLALGITPTLLSMLGDALLLDRYEARLAGLNRLAAQEEQRTRADAAMHRTAWFYVDHFSAAARLFHEQCGRDLVATFAEEAKHGDLELLGGAATHAILPLLKTDAARRAQLRTARRIYRRHLGHAPAGIWLPECAYAPGLDRLLADEELKFFFLESSSVLLGSPRPRHGTRAPVATPGGPAAFPRDIAVANQVWGSRDGFPGHPLYREFYRDLAFDAELGYLEPFLHSDQVRRALGIKYHRITGRVPLYAKEPWDPVAARSQARAHAREFVEARLAEAAGRAAGRPPLSVATFDAELFGHWWFEGPWFVEELFREMAARNWALRPVTPSEWLERYGPGEVVQPAGGTWGSGSSFSTWLNPDNAWVWRHLHAAEEELARAVAAGPAAFGVARRTLDQALRELLLAQSSDWPFIMTRRTVVSYAVKRFREHLHSFRVLMLSLANEAPDPARLAEVEASHPFAPEADHRDFS